jgi:signal peptidase II
VNPTLRVAAVTTVVVAIDQVTKLLARAGLDGGDRDPIFPFLELVNVRNTGVAFGFLAGAGEIVTVVTGIALVGLLVFFAVNRRRPLVWLPVGLLLGGAIGNIIDRVDQGYVTDFLKIPAWPAFNVADIAITFGVLSLLYVVEGPPKHAEAD